MKRVGFVGVEDIVAVAVRLSTGEDRFFLTWGRIQDPVDPTELEGVVLRNATHFAIGGGEPVSARLCTSLQEASGAPLFYECFFDFCQRPIPFGSGYQRWRKRMARRMEKGREIAFLGPFFERSSALPVQET